MSPLGISVLRCVRLLRIFKITRLAPTLVMLLYTELLSFLSFAHKHTLTHFIVLSGPLSPQILELPVQPGSFPSKLSSLHRFPIAPALPLHHHILPARHAALWGEV